MRTDAKAQVADAAALCDKQADSCDASAAATMSRLTCSRATGPIPFDAEPRQTHSESFDASAAAVMAGRGPQAEGYVTLSLNHIDDLI